MSSSPAPFTSRADLHVHSKYSDRPSEWVLRRVGAPECFVEPRDIYDRALAAGMDYVTISDHNKIGGALEIADLPGTFISSEITTYFPDNGAKMHVLVSGISEGQFEEIQGLRDNIFEFRAYLLEQGIIHSVAHPLFLVNDRLTVEQVEQLLVLFNRFELINGTRDGRAAQVVEALLDQLTPEMLAAMADRHGIEPAGPAPHRKVLTGGSDDHSGLYIGSAHTVTPHAEGLEAFLDHLRQGRHDPAGRSGSSIHLAHCFYEIAYSYYKSRLIGREGSSLLGEMLKRLLDPPRQPSGGGRMKGYIGGWLWRRRKQRLSETEQLLIEEFSDLFARGGNPAGPTDGGASSSHPSSATEAFETSCALAHRLGAAFFRRFLNKVSSGDLVKSLEALAALGPVAAAVTPYLAAFKTQHKDEAFIQRVTESFELDPALRSRGSGRAWLTDTFDDVNGVSRSIRTLAATAAEKQYPLTVLTSLNEAPRVGFDLKNFRPIDAAGLPEYPQQQVAFPPFMQIIEYLERRRFGELILSTPGPMGLTGLLAAKLLRLPTVGIYHTDFPKYIHAMTDDISLEALTWRYMSWFFDQCDTILVSSEYYRRHLVEHGFRPEKIRILYRGVDTRHFHPHRRLEDFWLQYGGREATTFLYVGRVSSEKNLGPMVDGFRKLLERDPELQLAIVGDGPMLPALRRRCADLPQVLLPGFLEGDELARAYASADVFVFPSTTDTFGNAVLEAQACGLPAIVTDRGGPQEIVGRHDSGVVVDLSNPNSAADRLAEAMADLANNPDRRRELGERALRTAVQMSWSSVLDALWSANEPRSTCSTITEPGEVIA